MRGCRHRPHTNALLEVTASSLEYWESPGAVVTAVQMAKGVQL